MKSSLPYSALFIDLVPACALSFSVVPPFRFSIVAPFTLASASEAASVYPFFSYGVSGCCQKRIWFAVPRNFLSFRFRFMIAFCLIRRRFLNFCILKRERFSFTASFLSFFFSFSSLLSFSVCTPLEPILSSIDVHPSIACLRGSLFLSANHRSYSAF